MKRMLHAGIVAAFAVVLLLVASVAHARDDSEKQVAGVSLDGTTYQESLDGPLFADEVSWAPGDLRVSRFWVRGPSDETGDLTIGLDATAVERLIESGRLKVAARTGGLPWRAVRPGKPLLLTDSPAKGGVPVSVRVILTAEAPEDARVNGSDLALTVKLGDTQVVGATRSEGGMVTGQGEAATWWVVPLGLILLSGGALLYGRREIAGEPR